MPSCIFMLLLDDFWSLAVCCRTPTGSPPASRSWWRSWKSWTWGSMSAPWCLSQRKVSSPQCWSQNNEKALPHINLTECPISRCRHLRKTNPGPWQWTDHIYGQHNQVLINPFSVSAKFVRLLSNRLTYFISFVLFFIRYFSPGLSIHPWQHPMEIFWLRTSVLRYSLSLCIHYLQKIFIFCINVIWCHYYLSQFTGRKT